MERPNSFELDLIEKAVQEIAALELRINELREQVRAQTRNIALESDGAKRLAIGAYAYWYVPETKVEDLSWAIVGDAKAQHRFRELIGPISGSITCDRCQGALSMSSRTEMAKTLEQVRKGRATYAEGYRALCEPCREEVFAERERLGAAAYRAKCAEERRLRAMSYAEYLQTRDWMERKSQHAKNVRFTLGGEDPPLECEYCQAHQSLEFCHKVMSSDQDDGWGDLDALILLCRSCRDALTLVGKILQKP